MKILSIDAWAEEDGWTWNNWFHVGDITKEEFETLDTDKKILAWMRRNGYITTANKHLAAVNDDQYNKVIEDAKTGQPVFAIEYGPEY